MRMLKFFLLAAAAAGFALAGSAAAQISLPNLPDIGGITQTLPDIEDEALEAGALRNVRRLQVRNLLRTHNDVLEADPHGQPIVRSRILAIAPSGAALSAALAAGFQIERRDELQGLGALVMLEAPAGMSTRRALRRLRALDPVGIYDFDHLHLPSASLRSGAAPIEAEASTGSGVRIGLIDSGVADSAPVALAISQQRGFSGENVVAGPHGEAVAAILAHSGARILVADIYGGAPAGGSSSAMARALAWLAQEGTPVINISLVGPRNRVVEAVVAQLLARGFVIVAAVGNDGPAAPPLYPASYPGVVGVTGVDARARILIEAGRGPQVDFAALGLVNGTRLRGTSFAAPIVARLLAEQVAAPDTSDAERAQSVLRARARDLGARGRDEVFGDGLVGFAPVEATSR